MKAYIRSKKPSSKKAFGLIYAAMFLVIVGLFLASIRTSSGVSLDRITNSHLRFQSSLYLRSLEDIALICANKPHFHQGRFDFGNGYVGGFALQTQNIGADTSTKAYLYVEAKNLRTGQILRSTKEVYLPRSNTPNK